jgi:hypothetical protein
VLVLSLATLDSPAQAGAAQQRGDWEATGAGTARASFAVVQVGKRVHGRTVRSLVVENLVVDAPITCANAAGAPAPVDVEIIGGAMPLSPRGSFNGGKIRRGNGTVASGRLRRGRFTLTYRHVSRTRNLYDGGTEVCNTGTIQMTARHGYRRKVSDGIWRGQTVTGEPVQFDVAADGRALVTPAGISLPASQSRYAFQVASSGPGDLCPYQTSNTLFVDPPGTFTNGELAFGDSPVVTGTFTGPRSVVGDFTNLAQGCGQRGWSGSPSVG